MDLTGFYKLGVALALSALVGLEREHRYQTGNITGFGGIRTFSMIGLLGALSYVIGQQVPGLFTIVTAGFFIFIVVSYFVTSKIHGGSGATSEFAAILVYLIGVLSALELYFLATSVAIVVLSMLYFKDKLHSWAKSLKSRELVSTIEFMIVTFVILPVLPNESYGPYDFFNPYIIWLMVVFISGISFLSYVTMKFLGQKRGIVLTGFLAGFISSTALAFSFSAESRKNRSIVNPFALAVIIASTAMFFRVLVEVSVLNAELVPRLVYPILAMGLTGVLGALVLWLKKEKVPKNLEEKMISVKSPFSLFPAIKFALLFSGILLLSKFGNAYLGDKGVYLTSVLSGVMDVDAITVSMANSAKNGLSHSTASIAIIIAAMTNTLAKGLLFSLFGNFKVALRILAVFGAMLLVGLATVLISWQA